MKSCNHEKTEKILMNVIEIKVLKNLEQSISIFSFIGLIQIFKSFLHKIQIQNTHFKITNRDIILTPFIFIVVDCCIDLSNCWVIRTNYILTATN